MEEKESSVERCALLILAAWIVSKISARKAIGFTSSGTLSADERRAGGGGGGTLPQEVQERVTDEEYGESGVDEIGTEELQWLSQRGGLMGESRHEIGETEEEGREGERDDREGKGEG